MSDEAGGPGPGPEPDAFELPEDMDVALKRLSMALLQQVMSQALREPDRPREELVAVVERLAANLRTHWGIGPAQG